ncbi:MAG TPA: hypothetical protein VNF05_05200 [Acidimicrobiales bacterium]|nr:hypothetical protein [Acidimicrobiales bacterium]
MRLRLPLVTGAGVLAMVCGLAVPSSAASSPVGTKTAAQILTLTTSAMKRAGSFHYDLADPCGGIVQITLSTESAKSEGTQTQMLGGGSETCRLIGKSLYMYGDKTSNAQDFGVKYSGLANKWALVPATNKNDANLASGILLLSILQQFDGVSVERSESPEDQRRSDRRDRGQIAGFLERRYADDLRLADRTVVPSGAGGFGCRERPKSVESGVVLQVGREGRGRSRVRVRHAHVSHVRVALRTISRLVASR